MSSLSFSNLSGIFRSNWKIWVEGWGNKRLRVEGGSNSVINWSNRETGVSHTESSGISNVLNLLELSVGINIGVSTGDSAVGVAGLLFDGVDVGVTVVQVAKLILGMELATSSVGGSDNWGGSSIGDSWSSSDGRSSSISDGRSSSSIGNSWESLNLSRGSNSVAGSSIWKTGIAIGSIGIASIGKGSSNYLSLFSKASSHKGGNDDSELHDVHSC